MVTEQGLKLRTRLESAKTLRSTTDSTTTHSAGDMIAVGDTIGVVVEDVGTNSDFVLVYEAEKIVVPKSTGVSLSVGQNVYYDSAAAAVTSESTGNTLCGKSLETADTTDEEALIDLIVLG